MADGGAIQGAVVRTKGGVLDGHELGAEGLDVLVDLVRDLLVQPNHEACGERNIQRVSTLARMALLPCT
jgi:hypothetical protein